MARTRAAAPDRDARGLHRALDAGLSAMAVSLDERARQRLLAYVELLQRWNRVYNLSAVRDPLEMIDRHVLDSLSALPYLGSVRNTSIVVDPACCCDTPVMWCSPV